MVYMHCVDMILMQNMPTFLVVGCAEHAIPKYTKVGIIKAKMNPSYKLTYF